MIYTISSYKKRKFDNENLLWFHEDIDLDDDEILNFIDNYFNDHMKLLLKIQKVINEK